MHAYLQSKDTRISSTDKMKISHLKSWSFSTKKMIGSKTSFRQQVTKSTMILSQEANLSCTLLRTPRQKIKTSSSRHHTRNQTNLRETMTISNGIQATSHRFSKIVSFTSTLTSRTSFRTYNNATSPSPSMITAST